MCKAFIQNLNKVDYMYRMKYKGINTRILIVNYKYIHITEDEFGRAEPAHNV